jgi:hypothetical protein
LSPGVFVYAETGEKIMGTNGDLLNSNPPPDTESALFDRLAEIGRVIRIETPITSDTGAGDVIGASSDDLSKPSSIGTLPHGTLPTN